jgi:hypothetical protein
MVQAVVGFQQTILRVPLCGIIPIDGQAKHNGQTQLDSINRTKKKFLAGPHGTTDQWSDKANKEANNAKKVSKNIVNQAPMQENQPQPLKLTRRQRKRALLCKHGTKATESDLCKKKRKEN